MLQATSSRSTLRPPSRCRAGPRRGGAPTVSAFAFTPMEAAVGGLTLGTLAFSRLVLSGRVLGISGIVKGVLDGQAEAWRTAFVTGLLVGSAALTKLLPSAFEAMPVSYTFARAVVSGLLVGFGTAMGNGCTSGHGICGNSRLSVRSAAATLAFMASGALAAYATRVTAIFALPSGVAPLTLEPTATVKFGLAVLAASVGVKLGLAALAKRVLAASSRASSAADLQSAAGKLEATALTGLDPASKPSAAAEKLATVAVVGDLFSGILFALGLGVSGMARPSKVAGFLGVLAGSFDPSLIFVMGGALLVSLPATQLALRCLKQPLCAPGFSLPSRKDIDLQLVAGELLFGAGWGAGGICPGPGIVALATLQPKVVAFVAAMLVGMKAFALVRPALALKA